MTEPELSKKEAGSTNESVENVERVLGVLKDNASKDLLGEKLDGSEFPSVEVKIDPVNEAEKDEISNVVGLDLNGVEVIDHGYCIEYKGLKDKNGCELAIFTPPKGKKIGTVFFFLGGDNREIPKSIEALDLLNNSRGLFENGGVLVIHGGRKDSITGSREVKAKRYVDFRKKGTFANNVKLIKDIVGDFGDMHLVLFSRGGSGGENIFNANDSDVGKIKEVTCYDSTYRRPSALVGAVNSGKIKKLNIFHRGVKETNGALAIEKGIRPEKKNVLNIQNVPSIINGERTKHKYVPRYYWKQMVDGGEVDNVQTAARLKKIEKEIESKPKAKPASKKTTSASGSESKKPFSDKAMSPVKKFLEKFFGSLKSFFEMFSFMRDDEKEEKVKEENAEDEKGKNKEVKKDKDGDNVDESNLKNDASKPAKESLEIMPNEEFVKGVDDFDNEVVLRRGVMEKFEEAKRLTKKLEEKGIKAKLHVVDSYRPLAVQREKFKKALKKYPTRKKAREMVADPDGRPPHPTGGALDLAIMIDHDGDGDYTQGGLRHGNQEKYLWAIMKEAGFYRYRKEKWHFESGTFKWAKANGYEGPVYSLVEDLDSDSVSDNF